ncbi:hypothetical protein GCM10010174_24780 [Kutzneria viridogrisea]|uniref:Uncharacterized protein n=1 Tax=Kutzneria viridogrisea TaxID=47990 RepID=A0ABR6BPV5_9PSEU|nr:hypothetical protein [Kutzneria viridogrisea]
MTDPFDLPDLPLPDSVRDSARQRILSGIAQRPRASKAPLLIAASVVVLAASATVVASTLQHADKLSPGAASTTTTSSWARGGAGANSYNAREGWAAALDSERCGRAATSVHPPRDQWQPIVTSSLDGVTLIAFRGPTGPFFCELTASSVSLSTPVADYPHEGVGQVLFRTANGSLAGVLTPGVRDVSLIREHSGGFSEAVPGLVVASLFLAPNAMSGGDLVLKDTVSGLTQRFREAELPPKAQATVDQPKPPGERTSDSGRRLGSCLDAASLHPPADAGNWQPGALIDTMPGHTIQLGRYGSVLGVCDSHSSPLFYTLDTTERVPVASTVFRGYNLMVDIKPDRDPKLNVSALVGVVNDEAVASITLSQQGQPDRQAVISNRTFAVWGLITAQDARYQVTAKDAAGKVLDQVWAGGR